MSWLDNFFLNALLGSVKSVTATLPLRSTGGTNPVVSIDAATTLAAGSMSAADKLKLDGISSGAAALTSDAPTTAQPDDVAAVGVATTAARSDHRHAIAAAVAGSIAIGDAAAEGASTSFARADHVHALPAPAAPTTIQPDDSASAGAATTVARSDHRHAIAAAVAGSILIGDSAAEGASTSFSRADHTHALAAPAAPATIGTANSTGAATGPARADHVHAHGSQTDGTLHAAANGTTPGFIDNTGYDILYRGGSYKVTAIQTSTYTAVIGECVRCDPTGGGFTVNLPTAVGVEGRSIEVKNVSGSTNTITIDAAGSETIDGDPTRTITTGRGFVRLRSDNANWMVV